MAYGQRGRTGCNHSPSSGEGNPKSATTPLRVTAMKAQSRSAPTVSSSSITPDLHLQELLEGYPGKQWPTVPCCLHSQVKGEPEPF